MLPSESIVYSSQELEAHYQFGDPDLGIKDHPMCELCERRFFDTHKLFLHLIDDHHQTVYPRKGIENHSLDVDDLISPTPLPPFETGTEVTLSEQI